MSIKTMISILFHISVHSYLPKSLLIASFWYILWKKSVGFGGEVKVGHRAVLFALLCAFIMSSVDCKEKMLFLSMGMCARLLCYLFMFRFLCSPLLCFVCVCVCFVCVRRTACTVQMSLISSPGFSRLWRWLLGTRGHGFCTVMSLTTFVLAWRPLSPSLVCTHASRWCEWCALQSDLHAHVCLHDVSVCMNLNIHCREFVT